MLGGEAHGFPGHSGTRSGEVVPKRRVPALLQKAGISQIGVGAESLNAFGETERYHAYVRNGFERVWLDHPDLNK